MNLAVAGGHFVDRINFKKLVSSLTFTPTLKQIDPDPGPDIAFNWHPFFFLVYVVVNFLSQVIFVFLLFLGTVMYANEIETKEK